MSLIVKYSTGSTYTLVANIVEEELVQDLASYHVPLSNVNGAVRLGLGLSRITISGDIASKSACVWNDITGVSFDSGTSYQVVYFASVGFNDDRWSGIYPYTLSLFASPLKEYATANRFPASGYQWGASSITTLAQAGNVAAYPAITYLAPKCYYPLTEDIFDFAGKGLTFLRAVAKEHRGISYDVNIPIYDSGLHISSETSQDIAQVLLDNLTAHTVYLNIKQTRYPSNWIIGGGVNLLTANQSNAETDTTGVAALGTLTRNTSTPIAGTGDFKVVATGSPCLLYQPTSFTAITANRWYAGQALIKTSGCAAGRTVHAQLTWYNSGLTELSSSDGVAIAAPTTATLISVVGLAPATAAKVSLRIWLDSAVASEIMYIDSLMLELLPTTLTVWDDGSKNKCTIDLGNNTIAWSDYTSTVSATFPTAAYIGGTVVECVFVHNGDTKGLHVRAVGGAWNDGSGSLAALVWTNLLTLGNLEGSISNLIQWPYVLVEAEYDAVVSTLAPLRFNGLAIANKYAETITKTSDGRLVTASGTDISGLLSGEDTPVSATATTLTMSRGLSARWYAELKATNI